MVRTPRKREDQLARVGEELKEGTWLANAQQRSQRRKSAWNLLLPLLGFPLCGAFAWALVWLGSLLHMVIYPAATDMFGPGPMSLSATVVSIPSFIAAICPALLLTNFLVYLIPPARRAMDSEDRNFPGTAYDASQHALLKGGIWLLAVCLPIIVAGAFIR